MAEVSLHILSRRLHMLLGPERDAESGFALGRHILRYWPHHLDTYVEMGMASLEAGLVADAADLFRRGLSADPEQGEMWAGLQEAAAALGLEAEAARAGRMAAGLDPEALAAGTSLPARAAQAAGTGAWRDAATLYHQVYRQAPARIDAVLGLATALLHLGRLEDCTAMAEVARAQLPYCLKAHLLAALGGSRLGDSQRTQIHAQMARSIDPDDQRGGAWFGTAALKKWLPPPPPAMLPPWDETEKWAFVRPPAPSPSQPIAAG